MLDRARAKATLAGPIFVLVSGVLTARYAGDRFAPAVATVARSSTGSKGFVT